jgi:hypothetical protein
VYNESLVGANIVEEKCLLDQVYANPLSSDIKLVILVVHPFLTLTHGFETIRMTPRLKLSSLGSVGLWNAYVDMFKIHSHRVSQSYNEFGTIAYLMAKHELNPQLKQMMRPGADFEVDPIAFRAYQDTVQEIHAHGARVVFVVPPMSQRLLDLKPEAFQKYLQMIQAYVAPGDKWVDFTSYPYAGFRNKEDNFSDGLHMEDRAAAEVVAMMTSSIAQ